MAVAAGAVFAFTTASAQSGTAVTFATIPTQKLAAVGVTLSAPQGPIPSAAAGEAAAIAATRALGNKVLEYHYAYCTDSETALAEDCWAVSLDPEGLRGGGTPLIVPSPATYLLIFIDPATDAEIEAVADN